MLDLVLSESLDVTEDMIESSTEFCEASSAETRVPLLALLSGRDGSLVVWVKASGAISLGFVDAEVSDAASDSSRSTLGSVPVPVSTLRSDSASLAPIDQ